MARNKTIESLGSGGKDVLLTEHNHRSSSKSNIRAIVLWLCSFSALFAIQYTSYIFYLSLNFKCPGLFYPPFGSPKEWGSFRNQSFAVGFDLTAGYGTASVAFNNGTIVNIVRVKGTSEYNDVLSRLSLKSSAHPTPPYYDCDAQSSDKWRQWKRYFRKRLGHPSSSDVAALSDVLGTLRSQTNLSLGPLGPLELAFITVPYLPALYNEDLLDAADHAKFQMLTLPWYIHRSGDQAQWPVSELNSAYAGNGFGLDNRYSEAVDINRFSINNNDFNDHNSTSHLSNPESPWSDNVFSVLFTNTALTAHVLPLDPAAHFFAADGIVNFTLGLSSNQTQDYWTQVRRALHTALDSYLSRGHNLGRVISYGESAHNEVFAQILEEEVRAAQSNDEPEKQPRFSSSDPVFAAARGAALFARLCSRLDRPGECFPDLRPRMQGW